MEISEVFCLCDLHPSFAQLKHYEKQLMFCKLASLITAEQLLPITAVVFF